MSAILKGTHGTTVYHAENIEKNGFLVSGEVVGKAGYGVYFWNYVSTNTNALRLSEAWWDFCVRKKIYDLTENCNLAIFDVEIAVDEFKILDMITNYEIHEAFMELYPMGEKEQYYGAKLDIFIKLLEERLGRIFEIVKLNLSVPELRNVAFSNSFPALVLKVQKNVIINNVIKNVIKN